MEILLILVETMVPQNIMVELRRSHHRETPRESRIENQRNCLHKLVARARSSKFLPRHIL